MAEAMRVTENVISLKNSLFAGNLPGDNYEQHSRPSQAVRAFGQNARPAEKGPHFAAFRAFRKVFGWHSRPHAPAKSGG
ncbi:hypothetical protein RPMA_07330 [Tardiphaga alba]|uniref:Uncharacterized protein n=1 Tax=Tardiphaga alba TaxID=340268 RepID=A0ABX8A540_9BRAD|nr:hypothetical protein [Tardiphaga alba]QUS38667.1 hypothetical protein RPMA_07330 [Tardiphaga alba]